MNRFATPGGSGRPARAAVMAIAAVWMAAVTLLLAGCGTTGPRTPRAPRARDVPREQDDTLQRMQAKAYGEFLAGAGNLRTTGSPPTLSEISEKVTRKAFRGAANVTTGILEIPKQTWNQWRAERTLGSPLVGFGKGVGMFLGREVVGVLELALCVAPVPADWEPMIYPEFVFQPDLPSLLPRVLRPRPQAAVEEAQEQLEETRATPSPDE